jgi:hypothetical protein
MFLAHRRALPDNSLGSTTLGNPWKFEPTANGRTGKTGGTPRFHSGGLLAGRKCIGAVRGRSAKCSCEFTIRERSMRIMTLLAAVVISGVLVGCSTAPTYPKPDGGRTRLAPAGSNWTKCAPNCTVHVQVIDDCKFDVTPLIVLSGVAGRRHEIEWVIQSGDYVFSTASDKPALDPKGSASFFGTPTIRGRSMKIDVAVISPRLSHEYGLNIVDKNGTVCAEIDPFLIE